MILCSIANLCWMDQGKVHDKTKKDEGGEKPVNTLCWGLWVDIKNQHATVGGGTQTTADTISGPKRSRRGCTEISITLRQF